MKLPRGMSRRIVVASILCGIVGLLTAQTLTRWVVRQAVVTAFAPLAIGTYREHERARCEASPERWSRALVGGARVFAYDGETLASRNPAAPPLDRALHAKLSSPSPDRPNEARVVVEATGLRTGTLVFRGAESGPCAIVQATWPPQSAARRRLLWFLLVCGAAVASGAAAFAFVMVVRPLTRRIDRLRASAERVGDEPGYDSASDTEDDALGALSHALDRAHARIRADAERLDAKRLDLERHLADVAHDLRTPIASLQIALEQALDGNHDPAVATLLAGGLQDAVYLAALTENLRLASRLREGWDPRAGDPRVDLGEAVERIVARCRFFARRRGIVLDVARPDAPVVARCHAIAAEQAIGNVVENAINYGDPGGHVAVVLETTGQGFDGRFTLTVLDDGPGVPPSELPRLGERTFRSDDARQRDPRGSGLGLAITSEVCARCGWTLGFLREAPRGLRVEIGGEMMSSAREVG